MLSGLRLARRNLSRKWGVVQTTVSQRRSLSSTGKHGEVEAAIESIEPPTRSQLIRVFSQAAVPMIGFGIMDQVSTGGCAVDYSSSE
jgi:hypothetical protein